MALPAEKSSLSYEDYLALEKETDTRHEFLNGEAWAMAGGTSQHSDLKGNIYTFLRNALRGRPCRPKDSDYKIYIPQTGLSTYPDVSVFCGPPLALPDRPNAAINPMLIVEVLSEGTEAWDRGAKFAHYRQIPTLRYYLLVNQMARRLELYTRSSGGAWVLTLHEAGETVPIPELGVSLPVDEVYADLQTEEVVQP